VNRIEIDHLHLDLEGVPLLDDVSLQVRDGELFGLIGPNGAGKSSLLKCIAQLAPYRGEIRLDGSALETMSPRERAVRLAYLSQGDHVSWPLALYDFVALGRLPYRPRWGAWQRLRLEDRRAIDAAIEQVQLTPLRQRRLDRLSGGERARARLARALAVQAPVLLADEPVASLDPFHQLNVMELLRRQCTAGAAVIVVIHDLTLASRFCDRVLLLDHGRAVACGDTRHVLTPKNLQQVYNVHAMLGEHQQQPYVLPWRCHPISDH